jgi:oxalate---CoA ligase
MITVRAMQSPHPSSSSSLRTGQTRIDSVPASGEAADTSACTDEPFVEPRDEVERQLVDIWERVFAAAPVGIRDNFFERGGSSLIGVMLLVKVAKTFGKLLPVSTLLHAPTIEEFAEILRQGDRPVISPMLRPIRASGSRPAIFFIHPAPGTLGYQSLVRHLSADQPAYELQAHGPGPDRIRFADIEEMAAHYVSEIRRLQRTGPYYLGGFCFGGIIAFEAAKQIFSQGEDVAFLFLFDAVGPASPTIRQRLRFHARKLKGLQFAEARSYLLSKVRVLKERCMARASGVPGASGGRPTRSPIDTESAIEGEGFILMKKEYTPRAYPGEITLFRSAGQGETHAGNLNGWQGVAAKGVTMHEVPGSHMEMFNERNVKALADTFRTCLEDTQAGAGTGG